MKTIQKTCGFCDKKFDAEMREIKRGNAKFCSRSCSVSNLNKLRISVKLICQNEECIKEYLSKNKNSKYCSTRCSNRSRLLRSGYKGNTRNKIKRDIINYIGSNNFKCFICGWDEDSCDIHHILPKSKGGKDDFSNLSVLCPNHHRLADRKKLNNLPTVSSRYRTICSSSETSEELEALAGN